MKTVEQLLQAKRKTNNFLNRSWLPKDLYPFSSRYFSYQGEAIHYIDEGEGTVLLFSHAGLAWSFMYREFIQRLSKHYRCIAIDYPGFGLSPIPDGYSCSLENQSKVLEALLDELNISRACFLGHDTGGPSAFTLAARRPSLVQGLILTDTIIFPVKQYFRINFMLSMLNTAPVRWLNRRFNFILKLLLNLGIYTRKLSAREKQVYLNSFKSYQSRDNIINILVNLKKDNRLMEQIADAFENQLNSKPTLLLYGSKDPVVQLGILDRIKDLMANAQVRFVEGEGHFPHEGQAEYMSNEIANWLKTTYATDRVLS